MPSDNKYKWTVGKEVNEDTPDVTTDNEGNEELNEALKPEQTAEDIEKKALEDTGKEEETSKKAEETKESTPGGNGYDPYADRDGGSQEVEDIERDATSGTNYNQHNQEQNASENRPSTLDKPQKEESPKQNGYQPKGPQQQPQGEGQVPNQSQVPAPSQQQALNQGGAGQPLGEKEGLNPQVPDGPASDPYDDKLGKPGENAAPGEGQQPNQEQPGQQPGQQQPGQQQPGQQPGGEGGKEVPRDNGVPQKGQASGQETGNQTPGLDKKDGLGDKPGNGLDNKDKPGTGKDGDGSTGGKSQQPGQQQANGGKPGGNGYGANRGPGQQGGAADPTANARKNLGHQNRANGGNAPGVGGSSGGGLGKKGGIGGKGGLAKSPIGNAFNSLKNKLNPANRGGNNKPGAGGLGGDGDGKSSEESSGFGKVLKKALDFIARHPYAAGIILIFLIILLLCIESEVVEKSSNNSSSTTACNYTLKGVTSTGNVNLDSLQVELINCDATEDNYTVLETIDFEKYVLGVALAEIGESSPDEGIKAQIIAARNFALTRNSGMCPNNPDGCFYGYNPSTGKIRMRACEQDQVYWDYTTDSYRQDRGRISLYSPEINTGTVWKPALSEERQKEVQALANAVRGKVLLDENGNVLATSYKSTDQVSMLEDAKSGMTYEEILEHKYGSNSFATATCSNYGNIDYGDYVLDSSDDEILHTPLDQFLSSHGTSLEAFGNIISSNVQKAGYGTRAGVVAAGVTLIAELGNNYNVKVPYYWGGGHYDGIVDGPLGYWGSTQCHTYANNQHYNYCGFDCSGFVPWAIKNGGFNIPHMLAGNFQNLSGAQRVSLSSSSPVLQPGDLLESEHHIVLVVGVDEENHNYICAEASGNARGVLFTRRSYADGGYWGVKMDGYYNTHQRSNG